MPRCQRGFIYIFPPFATFSYYFTFTVQLVHHIQRGSYSDLLRTCHSLVGQQSGKVNHEKSERDQELRKIHTP
jgi:hypothetical protein